MAIDPAQIVLRRSTKSGTVGYSLTQPDRALSLGKYISTTAATDGLNTVFGDVSGDDNANLVAKYVCYFLDNTSAQTAQDLRVAFSAAGDPAGGADVAIALDTTAATARNSASAQALSASSIGEPGSSITGLTWLKPTSDATGLQLGDLPAGYVRAIWIRLVGAAATAPVLEQIQLVKFFTTAP